METDATRADTTPVALPAPPKPRSEKVREQMAG